jgi:hypothetical protein
MQFPCIKLYQLYSFCVEDSVRVIFEELDMVNIEEIHDAIQSKRNGVVSIADSLRLDTSTKTIQLTGYQLNKNTWIVTKDKKGDGYSIQCTADKKDIQTALEYLYHMLTAGGLLSSC